MPRVALGRKVKLLSCIRWCVRCVSSVCRRTPDIQLIFLLDGMWWDTHHRSWARHRWRINLGPTGQYSAGDILMLLFVPYVGLAWLTLRKVPSAP